MQKAYPLVLKHTLLSTLLTEFKLYWGKDENNDYMKEFKGCRKESGKHELICFFRVAQGFQSVYVAKGIPVNACSSSGRSSPA